MDHMVIPNSELGTDPPFPTYQVRWDVSLTKSQYLVGRQARVRLGPSCITFLRSWEKEALTVTRRLREFSLN